MPSYTYPLSLFLPPLVAASAARRIEEAGRGPFGPPCRVRSPCSQDVLGACARSHPRAPFLSLFDRAYPPPFSSPP